MLGLPLFDDSGMRSLREDFEQITVQTIRAQTMTWNAQSVPLKCAIVASACAKTGIAFGFAISHWITLLI
jgi:hypothetical protein